MQNLQQQQQQQPAQRSQQQQGGTAGGSMGGMQAAVPAGSAAQELRLHVPTIGARLDSRQFEVLMDVIQNIAMAPLPTVRAAGSHGQSPPTVCSLKCLALMSFVPCCSSVV
jgi:hypothetical protein